MSGSFTVSGSDTTIIFQYTTPTTKMNNILTAAAHALWDLGYGNHTVTFESLTKQQKIDLIDANIKQLVIDLAAQYVIPAAVDPVRAAATTDASVNYSL